MEPPYRRHQPALLTFHQGFCGCLVIEATANLCMIIVFGVDCGQEAISTVPGRQLYKGNVTSLRKS